MKSTKKLVLVTGASGGIGQATARRFLDAGYAVALGYHAHAASVAEIEKKYPDAYGVAVDIGERRSITKALTKIQKHFGQTIDVVVNNASIIDERPFETITDAQWDRVLQINLRGAFIVSQEVLPAMRKNRWGRVVNIASIGGQWGGVRQVHYAAAKAGLISLTHSLSKLYAKDGITSNAVSPGLVDTPMIGKELRSREGKKKVAEIPIGRIARPEEIAAVVAFLCSDDAAYITGQTINVNGGMLFS